ncbi:Xaa-His dipeptidase Metallo peptidase. MEROPS family M20C [Colwellia chukchiensis]|uniref:Cytosol non-specific dipeptidase n=1 Tax=Colwellia chukchiensis TaxID=641665 RepID=A0A1H7QST2_9GAMM|nr:aminoacyl-histidine dipeptidase [Colwellia chukchiensis]SEL51036.1 Xaa-His dipeptidase Metallo peptidase. MEROPS family M20C [Colwellia chukchiensis]
MSTLAHLQPNKLWQIFQHICSIPHPSKHEQKISLWIQSWAQELGLNVKEDAVGNLIIKKPATAGMENKKGVILQAHMDMVPQKKADTEHDFLTDAIKPYIISEADGDWVTAEGTTLGADNGIGLASALAVLGSDDIPHGPLEVLVTIDEEAGMTGAFGLEAGWLEGELLINTDSEQEGEVYMGCAGGIDGEATFAIKNEAVPADVESFNLSISGLKGGHSGVDIHTGRANANKLLVRFLLEASHEFDIRLTELNGGSLRNAIPREADASFVISRAHIAPLKAKLAEYLSTIRHNLSAVETGIDMLLISPETFDECWTQDTQATILRALNACPNGVLRMSDDIAGIVETSLNLGVMRSKGNKFVAMTLIRSLHDDGRLEAQTMVQSVFELAGASIKFSGAYPGWKPDTSSPLMQTVRDTYQTLFNKVPEIMVIHAGLECGLFKTAYPHWDMVSFGPTIKFPHSPDEKVQIATVAQYWQLLVAVLANIPARQ